MSGEIKAKLKTISDTKISEQIYRILIAFANRNYTLGYCQGFNLILAKILFVTNFDEEKSFILFSILLENIVPLDFYLNSAGIEIDCQLILEGLEEIKKRLMIKLKTNNAGAVLYGVILKWVSSLFCSETNLGFSISFFDILFYFYYHQKRKNCFYYVVYYMCFVIFECLDSEINDLESIEMVGKAVDEFLAERKNNKKIFDKFFDFACKDMYKVRLAKLLAKRKIEIEKIYLRMEEDGLKKLSNIPPKLKAPEELKKCSTEFPLCVADFETKFLFKTFVVFRTIPQNDNVLELIKGREDYLLRGRNNINGSKIAITPGILFNVS
ncbi:MAG: TBC domain-containing protein, partial [archaeon]|nr:TBC domain-containing protein [archaeon]